MYYMNVRYSQWSQLGVRYIEFSVVSSQIFCKSKTIEKFWSLFKNCLPAEKHLRRPNGSEPWMLT